MAISKQQKKEILEKLIEKITRAISLVFVGYEKIKIKDQDKLRKTLKKEEGELLVTKKTILDLALKNLKFKDLENLKLDKEVALVLSYKNEIMPAKIIVNFLKENENLKIKGGIFEKRFIDPETIKFLASIPSKQILQGQLVTTIQSPLSGLVYALEANLRSLVYIFDGLANQYKS